MMQTRDCLRQDTETTLPELTEQHRIRVKKEELNTLESVRMAESETECAAPGLNSLKAECVTAHSGVSAVHQTQTTLIKTETDLGSTHMGDLIKTERLDSTELGYVNLRHSDQIKTEADYVEYHTSERISYLQDIKHVNIKSSGMKWESSEGLDGDLMNTGVNGAAVDPKDQTEPGQFAKGEDPNCKKEEFHDLLTQSEGLNHHCDISNEGSHTKIVHQSTIHRNKHINCLGTDGKNPSLLNFRQKKTKRRNKSEINIAEKRYKCTQCEKCFGAKSGLNKHLQIHTDEKPHKCSQCGKSFSVIYYLNAHQKIHTGEKPYKCSQCGKCFSRMSHLNSHHKMHTGEKPYKCSQCGKCFTRIFNLNSHHKMHAGEKPYECSQCGKVFIFKYRLNTHLRVHTGEKPYTCPQCGKCFSRISHLNSHQTIHTGEKPYKCTDCGKCFSQSSALKGHRMIHTGEKPYTCDLCGKCFYKTGDLNCHKRIHTGEKPYKCTQCGKCFSQKSALNCHKMIHSGEKSHNCSQCGKSFSSTSHLNRHTRIHNT